MSHPKKWGILGHCGTFAVLLNNHKLQTELIFTQFMHEQAVRAVSDDRAIA
jgi:aerobic-type carbon monoxide dehydrogenase small subunit (CoxS/CutS family)